MAGALEEHDAKVRIGGRNITNLRLADDINVLAQEEQELEALVESLDKTWTRFKMIFSTHEMKYVWYLPKKVNFLFIFFRSGEKLTYFIVISR